ncbi:MAG: YdcF family protein [Pseudohongiella sp.]|nr:YdcF family protein [Pseudohongiella sp.]
MDTLFFLASKIIWAVISPDSLIVLLGVSAWLALVFGWMKLSRRLLACCALLLLLIGFFPLGEWLISPLENRFVANAALPARVDGIIVLGGAISPRLSNIWQQAEMNGSADRLTNFLYLANLYPSAQLVFTGGNGSVSEQEFKEADMARVLFDQLGLAERAFIYESESRNTYENALNSKTLVSPQPEENWLLVTSAFHMPRSIGSFCAQQWALQPYPVDHYGMKGDLWRLEFNFTNNLDILRMAIREWVGLVAYRVTGKTEQFLPGDQNYCGSLANTNSLAI